MKMTIRFLSLVLALLLAFSGAAVAETEAEQVNMFHEYSTEELLAMKIMLETEIASRDDATDFEVTVPIGRYTVGVDIPARAYVLTNPGEYTVLINVYDQDRNREFSVNLASGTLFGKMDLMEGYIVEISRGSVTFSRYKGLGF